MYNEVSTTTGEVPVRYTIHPDLGVCIAIGDAIAIQAATNVAATEVVQARLADAPSEDAKTGLLLGSVTYLTSAKRALDLLDSISLEAEVFGSGEGISGDLSN